MYYSRILGGSQPPLDSGATAPIQLCVLHKRINKALAHVTANIIVPLHALLAVANVFNVKALLH